MVRESESDLFALHRPFFCSCAQILYGYLLKPHTLPPVYDAWSVSQAPGFLCAGPNLSPQDTNHEHCSSGSHQTQPILHPHRAVRPGTPANHFRWPGKTLERVQQREPITAGQYMGNTESNLKTDYYPSKPRRASTAADEGEERGLGCTVCSMVGWLLTQ